MNSGHGNWSVCNSDTVGDALEFRDESAASTRMMINSAGNVGVGTDNPGARLYVNGDAIFANNGSNINIKNTWSSGNHDINFIGGSSAGGSANNTAARIRCLATAPGGAATGSLTFTVNSGDTFVDALYIKEDGNIGIGTPTPTVGNLQLRNSSVSILALTRTNGNAGASLGIIRFGNTDIDSNLANIVGYQDGTSDSAAIAFQTQATGAATATRMTIRSGGNIGIGTAAPAAHLHVSKASGTTTVLTQVAANSTVGFEIKKTGSTTQHWKIVDGQTANGTLEFYDATNSATRMAITGSGSVGLNKTPNSQYNLDIEGQMLLGGHMNFKATNSLQGIGFNRNVHTGAIYSSSYYAYQLHSNANNFELQRYNGSGTFLGYGLVCTATGNVGINTNAPAARLESYITSGGEKGLRLNSNFSGGNAVDFIPAIAGVSNAGFSIDLAGTNRFTINGSGNVGIGTNNGVQKLHLQSATCIVRVVSTTANANASIWFNSNVGGTNADRWEIGTNISAGSSLEIYDRLNGASRMVVKNDGNVGIGTNNPGGKLHVYGGTTAFTNLSDNTDSIQITRNASVHTHQDAKLFIYDNSNADWAQKIELGTASYGLRIGGWTDYGVAVYQNTKGLVFSTRTNETVINDGAADYDFRVEGDTDDYLLFTEGSTDRVAISTTAPAAKLHVEGDFKVGTTNNGNWMGYKDVSLNGNTYTTALTINLNNHTGCYVKLFLSGDWSSHSAVAFVGEYFVQNGSDGYAEPGTVISEFDNTNTDSIESKIVDPSSDTFTIQLKLSTAANGTLAGKLSYHVMGMATAVS